MVKIDKCGNTASVDHCVRLGMRGEERAVSCVVSCSTMPLPDNETFNIKFVQAVEKYKCLYDTTSPRYISRDEQDKAWSCLAEPFSSTGAECKLRWKHLRGGLTRYIKKRQASKSIKQFYLWDVMQFVLPFLKSRTQIGNLPPPNPEDDNEDPADVEDDNVDYESDIVCESVKEIPETPSTTENGPSPPSCASSVRRGKKRDADDPLERAVVDFISKNSGEESVNPDLQFFKSILPDVAGFSASQKRRFKIKVLQLIDDIANEGSASRSPSVVSAYSGSTNYNSRPNLESLGVMGEPTMKMEPWDPDT
ncbi:uncharacterized protein LOC125035903 [Penaeus chinensis]|uniref:uncharacterized protein LOC125035903 n=1 Tax=Penaeus chinensis TaxID=139456 RepID=UPI001FB7B931|nr:uncharacterized protein LOC125035903 [Penaeus chinensis]